MTSSPPPPADGPAEMPAGDILYSLPTIAGALPPLDADGDRSGAFVVFEDDWRQVELVAARLRSDIEDELAAIRAIYDGHAHGSGFITGFDAIHLRSQRPGRCPTPFRCTRPWPCCRRRTASTPGSPSTARPGWRRARSRSPWAR